MSSNFIDICKIFSLQRKIIYNCCNIARASAASIPGIDNGKQVSIYVPALTGPSRKLSSMIEISFCNNAKCVS